MTTNDQPTPSHATPMQSTAGLSLERRAQIVSGRGLWSLEAIPELDLDSIVVTDGPHGVRKAEASGLRGAPATCFPTASALASTWDVSLIERVGAAIGAEARALGVAVVLGPGANIKRHPYCGRNFEYFSEDPHLTGHMAAAMIQGLQSQGVGASLKHFAVNNQETDRMVIDVIVDDRALREIYLAGFEHAVTAASPWTVMCAYNRINGASGSQNAWLLNDVLRQEWGFDGLVMTDWGASDDRIAGVAAGLDLEMPGSHAINDQLLVDAVGSGALDDAALTRAADRVAALIARSPGPQSSSPADLDANHDLACTAAAAGTVLLTNDGVLPLTPDTSIAVIGAFAERPRFQGAGSSQLTPTRLDTPLDAIRASFDDAQLVTYAAGYDRDRDEPRPDLVAEAVQVATQADRAIVFVGLPSGYETEGQDRTHLRLPQQHNDLVRAICEANPNTVVVLCNGSAIELPWVDAPRAVVEGHLGGQAVGTALADILFGRVNPSGRLAETFPLRASDHVADDHFPGDGRQVQYRESLFVGYRWFDASGTDVLFPFGHGLSYTTFEWSDVTLQAATLRTGPADFSVRATVRVTNTGDRHGAEVVQLYVRPPGGGPLRAPQELRSFARVDIAPGETEEVVLRLDRRSFAVWDVDDSDWRVPSGGYEIAVGASSRDIRSVAQLEISPPTGPAAGDVTPGEHEPTARLRRETLGSDETFAGLLGRRIPPPEPVRPFHRNSTLGEIQSTVSGAQVAQMARAAMLESMGGLDDVFGDAFDEFLRAMPLRSMASMSGGKVSWSQLDLMIEGLNAEPPSSDTPLDAGPQEC